LRRVLILGAGGRDLHVFNTYFRDNPQYRVVGIVQVQIPGLGGLRYLEGAGSLYPGGVPIIGLSDIENLPDIIKRLGAEEVVLAYSDLLYSDVGRIMSIALSSGASFRVLGPRDTMLHSVKPVIAVVATRTGAGKSTVSREIVRELLGRGFSVAVVRHPMAYRNLDKLVQSFKSRGDLIGITLEEREEYEQYIEMGVAVYAGIDYSLVLREAESSDIILWDGGNNDYPFFSPDYVVTVTDARRPGHEINSFPGEVNLRMANSIIITKVSDAGEENVRTVVNNARRINPRATLTLADLEVSVDKPEVLSGRRALVIEDAPTVTHGGLPHGAGYIAAKKFGAEVVDPKPYAVGTLREIYNEYPHIGPVLPSLGYSKKHLRDLEETLGRVPADVVVIGTPARIEEVIKINLPSVRVSWRLKVIEGPGIGEIVNLFLERLAQLHGVRE